MAQNKQKNMFHFTCIGSKQTINLTGYIKWVARYIPKKSCND